jgi:hypothetical protein
MDLHVSRIGEDLLQTAGVGQGSGLDYESVLLKSKEYDHFKKPFKHG